MTASSVRRQHAGVTMLELLIVIAIVGVLLSIAASSWTQYQRRLRLDEASQQVALTLRRVGENAITQSRGLTVAVSSDALVWSDTNGKVGQLSVGNNAAVNLDNSSEVVFSGRGLPLQMYQLEVSRDGLSRQLFLQPTGMVTVR